MKASAPIRLTDEQRTLVEENIGLVGYAITYYGTFGLGANDDTFQIGVIGLIKAATKFDPRRGKFSTYAVRCVRDELRHERRYRTQLCRGGGKQALSIDAILESDGNAARIWDFLRSGEVSVEEYVETQDFIDRVVRLLGKPDSVSTMITRDYLLTDATQTEIAKRYGVSQACVSRCVRDTVRLLKKALREQDGVIP